MPRRLPFHPFGCVRMSECIVHLDLGRFVEAHRLPSCRGAAREGVEGLVPLLEVLQFLAQRIIEERGRMRRQPGVRGKRLQFLHVFAVFALRTPDSSQWAFGLPGCRCSTVRNSASACSRLPRYICEFAWLTRKATCRGSFCTAFAYHRSASCCSPSMA